MKILFKLVGILLTMALGYFAYTLKSEWIAISGLVGIVIGICFMQSFVARLTDKLKSYTRQVEKIDISDTENSSKVKVLEQKIVVLEQALKNALEDKN